MPTQPVPPDDPPIDPSTGEPVPAADMREEFSRMSGRPDPAAEEAFVEGKLDMIRSDPALTEAEKQAAVAEVRRKAR